MGLFGRKDWNVIAVIFERKDVFRVNGNRARGSRAAKVRDGAKGHERTIFWAVFDQKRAFLEGDAGRGGAHVSPEVIDRIRRELPLLADVREVLTLLESGRQEKAARQLRWDE
ncbi:MAG: hypothetical protein WD066_14860 [Planctomycetaceae bacterium]